VIATLAAQYILLDSSPRRLFSAARAASANPFSIFGYTFRGDRNISTWCWHIYGELLLVTN